MCPRGAPESASRNAAAGAVTRLRVGADPTRTRGWVLGARRIVCESVRKSLAFREKNAERESRETAYGVPAGSSRGHAGRYDRGNRRSSAIKREFRSHPRMRFLEAVPFFPLFPSHHGFGLVRAETRETIERGRRRGGPSRSRAWNDDTSGVSRHDRARRRRARTLSLFPPPPFGLNTSPVGVPNFYSPRRIESNRIESKFESISVRRVRRVRGRSPRGSLRGRARGDRARGVVRRAKVVVGIRIGVPPRGVPPMRRPPAGG